MGTQVKTLKVPTLEFSQHPPQPTTVQNPSLCFCKRASILDTSNIREGSSQHLLMCFMVVQPPRVGLGMGWGVGVGLANLANASRGINLGSGTKLRGLLDTCSHMLGL